MPADPGVRKTVTLLLVFVTLVLAVTWSRQIWLPDDQPSRQSPPALQQTGVVAFPEPQSIDPFTLVDQDGAAVTRDDLNDQWTVAFLGYSGCRRPQCEDIFQTLGRFVADLETTTAVAPEFWYVTVDPARDNPETLRDYLQPLNVDVRGLTGEPEELQSLAASLKGAFNPAASDGTETDPPQDGPEFEFSDHLGLIAPDASLVAIVQQPLDSRKLAEAYRQLIAWYDRH